MKGGRGDFKSVGDFKSQEGMRVAWMLKGRRHSGTIPYIPLPRAERVVLLMSMAVMPWRPSLALRLPP